MSRTKNQFCSSVVWIVLRRNRTRPMLSNVSDDQSGWKVDRLLTYYCVPTKNAILGMHLAFFVGTKGVHIVSLLAGTRGGGVEAAPVACFLFHILIVRVWFHGRRVNFFFIFGQRCVEMSGFTPGPSPWRTTVLHVRIGLTGQQLKHL